MARPRQLPEDKLKSLLFTWNLRSARGTVRISPDWLDKINVYSTSPQERETRWIDFERRFGSPHFEERSESLNGAIAEIGLKRGALKSVYKVLLETRRTALQEATVWGRNAGDRREQLNEISSLLRQLHDRLLQLELLFYPPNEADDWDFLNLVEGLQEHIRKHRKNISSELSVLRRGRRGQPSKTWLKTAERELKRLGISRRLRKELFTAVGLRPYRDGQ